MTLSITVPLIHFCLLNIYFQIKVCEAEVLTELLIIKPLPVHS